MMYLDLSELPGIFDPYWLWSARRPALARFSRRDYLGDAAVSLDTAVRDVVAHRLGRRPAGPIRMLTHLRYFGYVMNPVTLYYCFNQNEDSVEAIAAEITNTPWNERHTYVLGGAQPIARRGRFQFQKAFHVSPFMDMDHVYDWQFTKPGHRLVVHMANQLPSGKVFDATLVLRRRKITSGNLARSLSRYPWMTGRVVAGIYWQSARLWLKRIPFYVHPAKRQT